MVSTPRRRDRKSNGKRQDLIDAAIRVIAREGVHSATTRRIAAEANLPLGTMSYWFAGKDDLLEEVITAVLDKLNEAVAEASINDPGDAGMLEALRAAWRVVEADAPGAQLALYELTALSLRTPGMGELARKQYAMYRDAASRSTDSWFDQHGGTLPGGPDALAQLVAALFDGLTLAWLADPEKTRPDEVFQLLSALLNSAAETSSDPQGQ
jgi:AcrR family transcriptional regulator